MGACETLGGDVLTDAFGIVAMVAMTPLFTIQMMGLMDGVRRKVRKRKLIIQLQEVEDGIMYFE